VFGSGGSIQLARVFGIRIGVEPSWFIVLFLIIWSLSGRFGEVFPGEQTKSYVLALVAALLFFASVLLHELGHAVVALRNGIGIRGIDLWMFGGVAKMERDTDSAGLEFRVAAAGPAVTLVIAVVCFGVGSALSGASETLDSTRFKAAVGSEVLVVLGWLTLVNAALLVFNLIPGFPLDGGRIARALIWWRTGDRARATVLAARSGRVISLLMIGGGALLALNGDLLGGVWLVFVGIFLGQAARQAEAQSAVTGRIEGLRVADVMDAEPVAVPVSLDLERTLDEYFARYGSPWFPVVADNGSLVGLVTRESVSSVPDAERRSLTVGSVMARDEDSHSGNRIRLEEPLESLLSREGLQRLGAIMAVDGEGQLRGIVTVEQVRRAAAGA